MCSVQAASPPLAISCQRLQQEVAVLEADTGKARAANQVVHGQKEDLMQLLLNEKRRVGVWRIHVDSWACN